MIEKLIQSIPKAELHIHIEGSLEPELMFALAERNGITLPFSSVEQVRAAYSFTNLQTFLDIYYQGAQVLRTEQDFYDMTMAYLRKARADNVRHCEIFFDPQTHTDRGIAFDTVIKGITSALDDAKSTLQISSHLILCFLRHLSQEAAQETLDMALPWKQRIIAIGLDSSEAGHPPEKFREVFARAKREGFLSVAHAGEEGPADYIWQAINVLDVQRIDHGIRCFEDPELVKYLARTGLPLTVCPLSNLKLTIVSSLAEHNLPEMLEQGLCATINSDDPAYFNGYINQNYIEMAPWLRQEHIIQLAKNSFQASFLSDADKQRYLQELDTYL